MTPPKSDLIHLFNFYNSIVKCNYEIMNLFRSLLACLNFYGAGPRTAIYNCNSLTTTITTNSSNRHIKAFIMTHYSAAAAARNLPFRSMNVFDEFNCTSRLQFKSDILEMTNVEQGTPVPQEEDYYCRLLGFFLATVG
ncbi:hypothetical protein T09_14156 [Trichinella sp. T9]|nr:hypothetical protein T09_14156 [Trichinella sp. T9]